MVAPIYTLIPKTILVEICSYLDRQDCLKVVKLAKFFHTLQLSNENSIVRRWVKIQFGFTEEELAMFREKDPLPEEYYKQIYKTCLQLEQNLKKYSTTDETLSFEYWSDVPKVEQAKLKLINGPFQKPLFEGLHFLFKNWRISYPGCLSGWRLLHLIKEHQNPINLPYFVKVFYLFCKTFPKEQTLMPNLAISNGYNFLTAAAELKLHDIMEFLILKCKANVNRPDAKQRYPLEIACNKNDATAIELLLKHKADPNLCKPGTQWPIFFKYVNQAEASLEIFKLLVDAGAKIHEKFQEFFVIHEAARFGRLEFIKFLLDRGAKIDEKTDLGDTALFIAIEQEYDEVARFLISSGADVFMREKITNVTEGGRTLLHLASGRLDDSSLSFVAELIGKGLNVNDTDASDETPLHLVASIGREEAAQLILKHDASVNVKDNKGTTPLMNAAGGGFFNILKLLIEKEADIDACDHKERTALHHACKNAKVDCALLLCQKGINPFQEDKDRNSSIDLLFQRKGFSLSSPAWFPFISLIISEYEKKRVEFQLLYDRLQAILDKGDDLPDEELIHLREDILKHMEMLTLYLHPRRYLEKQNIIPEEFQESIKNIQITHALLAKIKSLLDLIDLRSRMKQMKISEEQHSSITIKEDLKFMLIMNEADCQQLSLPHVQNYYDLVACGLLNHKDLEAIGIHPENLNQIMSLQKNLKEQLENYKKAQSEQTDSLKQRSAFHRLATEFAAVFNQYKAPCAAMKTFMSEHFGLEEFIEKWNASIQKAVDTMTALEAQFQSLNTSTMTSEKDLLNLYAKMDECLLKLGDVELERLFILLDRYLSQPNLISVMTSLRNQGIYSISQLKSLKFKEGVSIEEMIHFLYALEQQTSRRLVD